MAITSLTLGTVLSDPHINEIITNYLDAFVTTFGYPVSNRSHKTHMTQFFLTLSHCFRDIEPNVLYLLPWEAFRVSLNRVKIQFCTFICKT